MKKVFLAMTIATILISSPVFASENNKESQLPVCVYSTEMAIGGLPELEPGDDFKFSCPSRTGSLVLAVPPNESLIFADGIFKAYIRNIDKSRSSTARVKLPTENKRLVLASKNTNSYGAESYVTDKENEPLDTFLIDGHNLSITFKDDGKIWLIKSTVSFFNSFF